MAKCGGSVAGFKRRCPQNATTVLLVGCIHEHVAEKFVCDEHLQRTLNGKSVCRTCRQHDGHLCLLHVGQRAPESPEEENAHA